MADLDQVLDWVNTQRSALKLPTISELPRGRTNSAYSCPLARALSGTKRRGLLRRRNLTIKATVGTSDAVAYDSHGNRVFYAKTPWFVTDFVYEFDRGLYPELVA